MPPGLSNIVTKPIRDGRGRNYLVLLETNRFVSLLLQPAWLEYVNTSCCVLSVNYHRLSITPQLLEGVKLSLLGEVQLESNEKVALEYPPKLSFHMVTCNTMKLQVSSHFHRTSNEN